MSATAAGFSTEEDTSGVAAASEGTGNDEDDDEVATAGAAAAEGVRGMRGLSGGRSGKLAAHPEPGGRPATRAQLLTPRFQGQGRSFAPGV